jgi:hypothetical protein
LPVAPNLEKVGPLWAKRPTDFATSPIVMDVKRVEKP